MMCVPVANTLFRLAFRSINGSVVEGFRDEGYNKCFGHNVQLKPSVHDRGARLRKVTLVWHQAATSKATGATHLHITTSIEQHESIRKKLRY